MRRKKTFRFFGVVVAALVLSTPIGVHAATVFETTGFITGVEGVSHPFTADVSTGKNLEQNIRLKRGDVIVVP